MFAQVARFKTKRGELHNVETEITKFRNSIKLKQIPIKQEIVLRNHNHGTWIVIALFDNKSDLDESSTHQDVLELLDKVKPHVDGDIQLFWSEVV